MSVNAINGADLTSQLVQNVSQGVSPDVGAGVNVLKKAISLSQDNAAALIASEGDAGGGSSIGSSTGNLLNVFG